ncbi:unnamed protein product [Brassica oleracea]
MSITEANTDTERKTISPYDEWATKFLIKMLTLTIKKFGSTDKSITEPAASSSTLEVWNGRYSAVRNLLGLLQMSLEESASIWKDRISLLPDSLLCHILSFLTTKEAVCTSVLSSRWRGLWKWVPSLDLVSSDFPSDKVCVDFINEFLLNFKSLSEFKLCIIEQDDSDKDASLYEPCLDKNMLYFLTMWFLIRRGLSDHVKVDIEVVFEPKDYDFSERNIIYYLINNFSAVKDMTLSWYTLGLIYCLQGMNPLPKFRNLSRLRATTWLEYSFELLPFVLESCPNLRHLTLKLVKGNNLEAVVNSFSKVLSFCLVSSLEYVDIESPITEKAREEEVVRYFLGNATSLKKLVLRLNVSDGEKHHLEVLKQRFDSPRRSSLCQFDVLLLVQTPDKMKEL